MQDIKRYICTENTKLECHWNVEEFFFNQYRLLKFHIGQGMIVDKIHEMISFKHSKWLGKYIILKTQKRKRAEKDFEKIFVIY